ncbi:UNVERIFIED_CONTAM: hypothetical protein NCL1_27131 [Trichonephila clavipes]
MEYFEILKTSHYEQMIRIDFSNFTEQKLVRHKLGMTPKETYAMLVRVYEDQAVSMKCVYECSPVFQTAEKVFLITPVAEDLRSLSVMRTLREVRDE